MTINVYFISFYFIISFFFSGRKIFIFPNISDWKRNGGKKKKDLIMSIYH